MTLACLVIPSPSHDMSIRHTCWVRTTKVVMDASNMWRAAGCDVCIRKIVFATWDANIAKH